MPKLSHKLFFSVLIFSVFSLLPTVAYAGDMDPKSATVSATATVPIIPPTTSDTTAPTSPILISPADGTYTSDNTPEFVWTQSTDPNGNYVYYTFYLNGTATYLGISNVGNSIGTGYSSRIDGSQIKLTPTNAFGDGSYTWYVTATDGSGNSSYSTTWSFVIDTMAPPLSLTDLESIHNPSITSGANFDIDGPLDVNYTLSSDPNTTIQINITGSYSSQLNGLTGANGFSYLSGYLPVGVYTVSILAIDRAGNTTFLPDFTLTIHQASINITLPPTTPGSSPTTIISIPYTPINLVSFPATIANIESRLPLLLSLLILLAILLLLLLLFLLKRRKNLILLDQSGKPIKRATIYHSKPTKQSSYPTIFTRRYPVLYELRKENLGKIYIPRLSRYSTLTIRVESTTYVISMSLDSNTYVIVLG